MIKEKTVLMPSTLKHLQAFGENIKIARLRRNFSMDLICRRAMISRPTLYRVEKGSPDVSIGIYASVLLAIGGLDKEFEDIAKEDKLGRTIQDLKLITPKRGKNE